VVSVTFRDEEGIAKTIESLRPFLADKRFELIVVDGGVSSLLAEQLSIVPNVHLISEKDQGIYDAMNKGARIARGDHIWFLNGGDSATTVDLQASRLAEIVRSKPAALHMFGYGIATGRGIVWRRSRGSGYIRHALPTSHQAMLFPRREYWDVGGYDLSFEVSADYHLAAKLAASGVELSTNRERLAVFSLGGLSTVRAREISGDAERVQREVLGLGWSQRVVSRWRHAGSRVVRRWISGSGR
jgi:putative colanic acid biosynthesis glycosyltransferase